MNISYLIKAGYIVKTTNGDGYIVSGLLFNGEPVTAASMVQIKGINQGMKFYTHNGKLLMAGIRRLLVELPPSFTLA